MVMKIAASPRWEEGEEEERGYKQGFEWELYEGKGGMELPGGQ